MSYTIVNDNNITHLKTLEDNTIDAIITDPPYGIEFLGKDWDKNTGAIETWQQCLRVLKPGGYLLAFSAARTYHNLATNIQQVGFEIRDQLMWLYASGFPKAQDIGKSIDKRMGKENNLKRHDSNKKQNNGLDLGSGVRCPKCKKDSAARYDCKEQDCGMIYKAQTPQAQQWQGWKTALKPSHEPIVMARKPFKGSTIDNVLTHGVGALNIDATRVPYKGEADFKEYVNNVKGPLERSTATHGDNVGMFDGNTGFKAQKGKVVVDDLEKMKRTTGSNSDTFKNFSAEQRTGKDQKKNMEHGLTEVVYTPNEQGRFPSNVIGEVEGYQKYFYCPKVSRRERHVGFEQTSLPDRLCGPGGEDWVRAQEHQGNNPANHQKLQLGDSAPQGERRCSKDSYERWQQSIEYRKGGKPNPLAHIPAPFGDVQGAYVDGERMAAVTDREGYANMGNNHPTVKPVALMRYLIKLVTPANSHVLDPFCGSGSTGMAAVELGHTFTGIELDANYVEIAKRRIEGWNKPKETDNTYNDLFEENK